MAVAPGSNFAAMGLGGPGTAPNYRASTAQLPGVMQGRAPWLPQGTALPDLTMGGGAAQPQGQGQPQAQAGGVPWHVQLAQQQSAKANADQAELARQKAQADALRQPPVSGMTQRHDVPAAWESAQQELAMLKQKDPTASEYWKSQGMSEDDVAEGLYRNLIVPTREDD